MDNDKIWLKIAGKLKDQIAVGEFHTFFKGAAIKSLDQSTIVLITPSAFHQQNINIRFLPILENAIEQVLNRKVGISFVVDSSLLAKKSTEDTQEADFFQPEYTASTQSSINPKFTLDNFVVGFSNNVAFAAAQAVAQNPGISYNPLFIYGGTGVGKTHLMLGIGNAILKKTPGAKIIYCSSEGFMNDYVGAIQNHKMGDFRSKYRSAHVLLIDDIQFFSGREGTQEEFFHTFNDLQARNSQVILTSDRSPNDIAKLEDRLKSRFVGGLMVDMQPPDFDTRVAILKAKSSEQGIVLPEDSLKLIASSSQSSVRELEGKLMQIAQTLKAQGLEASSENIASFLNLSPKKSSLTTDYKQVLSTICSFFNMNIKELTGPKRQKGLVLPRHIAMYILSEELGLAVEKVGQILGGRDHTTVMHGRDRIKGLLLTDSELQQAFATIKQGLIS